jgi:hypothetical protein
MSRENGESHGLWPANDQVVPLTSPSATVTPAPNGDRAASALAEEPPERVALTAGEFTTERHEGRLFLARREHTAWKRRLTEGGTGPERPRQAKRRLASPACPTA